jgi:hypothetical protein
MRKQPILDVAAMARLAEARQQILEATADRIPERLLWETVAVALELVQHEAIETVLPERVAKLVRASLAALAQQKWKPDTALRLRGR